MKKQFFQNKCKKKVKERKYRFINGTKGVISIFLAILMVPFTAIAGSLINAARINSAVAIFDEALCNASNSTLGTYDSFLKKRFGLLAMSQDVSSKGGALNAYTVSDLISETFEFYMQENLKSLSNTYITSESTATGVYPLADTDVLYTQILEYSKYNVPTQLVVDGLSIDDMIRNLENMIPGKNIIDMITSGAKVADSMVTLAQDFEFLKDAVSEQETAESNYTTAYETFSGAVSAYRSTKSEMEVVLPQKQNTIDTERAKISSIVSQLEKLESDLKNLKNMQASSGSDYSTQIKQKQTELDDFKKNHKEDLQPWQDAKDDYATTKTYYEETLQSQHENVKTSHSDYKSKIGTLIGKIKTTKEKLTTVQSDILSMGNSVAGMTTTAAKNAIESIKQDNKEKITANDKLIAQTTDANEKARLEAENKALREQNDNLDNNKSVIDAQKSGYEAATQSMKEDISSINTEAYTAEVEKLTSLQTTVAAYDTTNVLAISKSTYYKSLAKILTSADVEEAEKAMVAECVDAAIWSLIESLIKFIEALFSAATIYDPNLKAVINETYYNETYGGLPSEKNRSVYPLSMGESGDAALSQYYKDLIGGHPSAELDPLSGMDIISKLMSIFNKFGIIRSNVTSIMAIVGLLNLAERIQKIMNAAEGIMQDIKDIIAYFGNMFSASAIGGRFLLAGYTSYMTSNRTTYTGSALTGTSFNLRAQNVPTGMKGSVINNFGALVDSIVKAVEGGKEKCFYGAETEYIIFGSRSELINQSATFLAIYGVRLVCNLIPIFSNTEVNSIAAASTIGAPIVYLLYVLLEPLVDTIILVNMGKLPLFKNFVYLTPSGLEKLIKKFTKLKLSNEQIESAKSGFLSEIGASSCADSVGNTKIDDESYFDIDYSQNLFVIMLIVNPQKILERLSNIIQMEAVEYMINKGMGSNGKFDLDYSYTYIRVNASFTTNEFIKLSESTGIDAKERILYRGY